jgi:hypothetical protein
MAHDFHRDAELLMGEADIAAAAGDGDRAAALRRDAANLESQAFLTTSVDRPRTRAALGVSSVALLRLGRDLDGAMRQAHRVLSAEGLMEDARLEVEMMLDEIRTEALARLRPHPHGLQWALRGGRVGYGFARLETFDLKIQQIQALAWRAYELLGGVAFRTTQKPSNEIRAAMDLLVSQPVAGSFVFRIHVGDRQLTLDGLDIDPALVTETLSDVVRASAADDATAINDIVPDEAYRNQFLRLIRNLSPDGHEVGEIEVRRIGDNRAPTILTPVTRQTIRRRIPRRPADHGQAPEQEIRDVLRVIDLNRRRIALGPSDREQKCVVPDDLALVDLVTGLEDRNVRVRGHWQGQSFVVHDIEPDDNQGE